MDKPWKVLLRKSALRELDQIRDEHIRQDIFELLVELTEGPNAVEAIPLEGCANYWRARVAGNFRVVYHVSEKQKRIIVTRIRHRSTVYEGL
jgi:addiction module RelE/StbE family toxin